MKPVVNLMFFMLLLFHHAGVSAIVFYVSPNGNDTWNGLSPHQGSDNNYGPFLTLERAQKAIREAKHFSGKPRSILVTVSGGEYILPKTLLFDSRDSGWEGNEIVWEGSKDNPVVINAGRNLQNCKTRGSGKWTCSTKSLWLDIIDPVEKNRIRENLPGFSLFVNDRRLQLARWPNTGWAFIRRPIREKTEFTFYNQPGLNIEHPRGAAVYIWPGNDWYDQYIEIADFNAARHSIRLNTPTAYPIAPGRRFVVLNHISLLESPWEWYYNSAESNLQFILPKTIRPKNIEVSYLNTALSLINSNNLVFKNFQIRNSSGTGVQIRKSQNIQFIDLEVSNTGGWGVNAQRSSEIQISNSVIHDTGLGGILLTGGDRATLHRSDNLIFNTHIHHVGQTLANFSPAVDLKGVGATIRKCHIEYTPANSVWIEGNEHLIEKNEINNICELASDCGAIYSGRDWTYRGNVIRDNSIHDLYGYGLLNIEPEKQQINYGPGGVRGVYLDDGASGFIVAGNKFYNAGFISIQIGGGRDNIIEGNTIETDKYSVWIDNRWPGYKWEINRHRLSNSPYQNSFWRSRYPDLAKPMANDTWPENNTVRSNVLISTTGTAPLVRYLVPKASSHLSGNTLWSRAGSVTVDFDILDENKKVGGAPFLDWLSQDVEVNSSFEDPCMVWRKSQFVSCALH